MAKARRPIAAVSTTPHSHLIVCLHNKYLIFLIKMFFVFCYAAQRTVKNSRC